MPAAVAIPGAGLLDGIGSTDLDTAAIPAQTSVAWTLAPAHSGAGMGPLILQEPVGGAAGALEAPVHGLAVFERIHVLPRRADLGAVLSSQTLDVEVWNAFRARAKILTALEVTGPPGVTIANPYGLPTHYPATESLIYVVTVEAQGDPRVDNLITWTFTGVDPGGTTLHLVGFRALPWPFEADMAGGIRETYGYLTNIMRARDGTEQRVQLRAVAIGRLTIDNQLLEARESQLANALLYGQQPRAYGVPLWQFREPLTAAVSPGATEIMVDTSSIPWAEGGLLYLWRSPWEWEVQRVEDVQADRLVTTLPVVGSWPLAGTWVMPLVIGRLSPSEGFSWESLKVGAVSLGFDVEGFFP